MENVLVDAPNPNPINIRTLTNECWREYQWPNGHIYRIDNPKKLFHRIGGCTHNIEDENGVLHCVPNVMYGDKPTGVVIRRLTKF